MLVLLAGRDDDDPLFLQIKEAEASVRKPSLGPATTTLPASAWCGASG
jgi:hypothetical protein